MVAGLLLLAAGCAPKVHLTLLEAADITVPSDVRTLALIDRSAPDEVGDAVLGALEGALTGEGIAVDREGARVALDGVAAQLLAGPRFEVAMPPVDVARGPEPMSRPEVAKVLAASGAEAVLALEKFDSDSVLNVTSAQLTDTVDGEEVSRTEFTADRGTMVAATWRLYDAEARVLDVLTDAGTTDSWQATGATRALAEQALPPVRDAVVELGHSTGVAYGRRISPSYADVVRDYFVRGDPRLRSAKHAVKAGDWKLAIAVWSEVARSGLPEIQARAEYDLAVAYEVKGQYRRALSHAEEAARLDPSARIVRYRDLLRAQIPNRRELQEQMKAVGGLGAGGSP